MEETKTYESIGEYLIANNGVIKDFNKILEWRAGLSWDDIVKDYVANVAEELVKRNNHS